MVLSVYPETEGNALEVARALIRRDDGRVVWLRQRRRPRPRRGPGGPPARWSSSERSERSVETSHRYRAYPEGQPARALGLPARRGGALHPRPLRQPDVPAARKPIVNLWHGDGPKDITARQGWAATDPSTYLVGSTALFSHQAEASTSPRTGC